MYVYILEHCNFKVIKKEYFIHDLPSRVATSIVFLLLLKYAYVVIAIILFTLITR